MGREKERKREQPRLGGAPVTFSYNSPLWRLSCRRGTNWRCHLIPPSLRAWLGFLRTDLNVMLAWDYLTKFENRNANAHLVFITEMEVEGISRWWGPDSNMGCCCCVGGVCLNLAGLQNISLVMIMHMYDLIMLSWREMTLDSGPFFTGLLESDLTKEASLLKFLGLGLGFSLLPGNMAS